MCVVKWPWDKGEKIRFQSLLMRKKLHLTKRDNLGHSVIVLADALVLTSNLSLACDRKFSSITF